MSVLRPESAGSAVLPADRRAALAALVALRPRQWTKNLLLFAGVIFADQLGSVTDWARAVAIVGAYCAVSSASYLLNDVRDFEHDRLHPTKRFRPIARGELPASAALFGAAGLLCGGFVVAGLLGRSSLYLLAAFAALQALYSLGLKRLPVADVLTIAVLFVVRAAAGASAIGVRISPWLLACTALLALFLALSKRRAELALVARKLTPGRPVLERYSQRVLEPLALLSAAAAAIVYAIYACVGPDSPEMIATIPFAWFGVGRYLFLVRSRDLGEEPEQVLLTDRLILGSVACFGLTAICVLAIF